MSLLSDSQALKPAKDQICSPLNAAFEQSQAREATQKRAQGDLGFQTNEWRADAVVDPAAEAEVMLGIAAPNIQRLRPLEAPRVTICCADQGHHAFADADSSSADLDIV